MANKFETKQWELEELGRIYDYLEQRHKDLSTEWKMTDALRQKYRWVNGERELLWEDEEKTIPVMENVWDDVVVPEDELSEEKITKRNLYKKFMEYIEKQI